MVTLGGAGLNAEPYANLYNRNLTKAYLIGADLRFAYAADAIFRNADLNGANLTDANFSSANFMNANLAQAEIRGAVLHDVTSRGFTAAQLYSTASYLNKDLSDIYFSGNNLTDWDFHGQNLTGSYFFSTTLTGVNFADANVRSVNFSGATSRGFTSSQLYSTASYQASDLTDVQLSGSDLSGWDFSSKNLKDASFNFSSLAGTDFTGANIRGAGFSYVTSNGFTASQLYSTASYQAHDLRGVQLYGNDLTGWQLAGKDLRGADFSGSTLTNTDFAGSDVRGAIFEFATENGLTPAQIYSTASYQSRDLKGIEFYSSDLTGWDFSHADLTGASFGYSTLTNANFSGAIVRDANFTAAAFNGFTFDQLSSTQSYQTRDLRGIKLATSDLEGWNFEGQNLSGADLSAGLSDANFRHANLQNVSTNSSGLWGLELADLTGADTRGASDDFHYATITTNMIQPNGTVAALDLTAEHRWVVRNDDVSMVDGAMLPPTPIHVESQFVSTDASSIEVLLGPEAWGSTISFATGIPVTLDGTLELDFVDDVDLDGQVGRSFDLFDWDDVVPTGEFSVSSEHTWDLTDLYTTGEVTLLAVAPALDGDFNRDDVVDAADYTTWRDGLGSKYTEADYQVWRDHFGDSRTPGAGANTLAGRGEPSSVPEPMALVLALVALGLVACRRNARALRR